MYTTYTVKNVGNMRLSPAIVVTGSIDDVLKLKDFDLQGRVDAPMKLLLADLQQAEDAKTRRRLPGQTNGGCEAGCLLHSAG